MKFRFIAALCIAILIILLISNRLVNHSILSSGSQVSQLKVQKVKWNLTTKKNSQEVTVSSRTLNVLQREKIRIFITTDQLKSYKVIEPVYNGSNQFTFKYSFKKDIPYYVSIFLNNQTLDTKIFQKQKDKKSEVFPTAILTKKTDDYRVSLLYTSILPKTKSKITFDFDQFKKRSQFTNQQFYIMNEEGTYFKLISNPTNHSKVNYELDLPEAGMYKIFYEFKLNDDQKSFDFILDVKDKDS
ncbi:hypothetical protein V7148_07730 [Gottfriedia acidiceleris]|uniref:hypothetical protein n=1 Tax=Bacillaceae TaxID=186817 RepID=UPI000BEB9B44|nr:MULTISPECIES: hypothetical protein [unclassified Bacillus (in: firmicutes)]PEC49933.1 hypothetical protein CON00_08740 [Bacillus sp. AFS096315]PFM79393.1 hypothetical protein COJ46_13980 [Bacillus sp. AFS077874]